MSKLDIPSLLAGRRPAAPGVLPGMVVHLPLSGGYAVVTALVESQGRPAAELHRIDPQEGRPMRCPDFGRCRHGRHCPIHGRTLPLAGLEAWTDEAVGLALEGGLLAAETAQAALAANAQAREAAKPSARRRAAP